jgi:hypothetical protein
MKLRKWLENWDMTKLKINVHFLEMEWAPQEKDRDAAWELYIELLTRTATQPLAREHGVEKAASESIHKLFPTTREIIKKYGRDCIEFTKIAIVVLNQIVRPFTAKWHKLSEEGAFDDQEKRSLFRDELQRLQEDLCRYTAMLSEMAGVEDLTKLESRDC